LVVLLVVGALLFALLYPAMHMKVGVPEASVLPERYESRAGDDILKEDFDYAGLTPIEVVATLTDDPFSAQSLEKVRDLGQRLGRRRTSSVSTASIRSAKKQPASTRRVSGRLAKKLRPKAARVANEAATEQLDALRGQYGVVPPGAEERVRAEAERRATAEIERQIPVLPDGVSADGAVTPEGVAKRAGATGGPGIGGGRETP
jgi:RND superfamily putative drug exporter